MIRRVRSVVPRGFALLLLAACDKHHDIAVPTPSAKASALPVTPLAPRLPELNRLAVLGSAVPPELTDAERKELRDIVMTAFSEQSESAIAAVAARHLENDPRAKLAYEAGLQDADPAVRAKCAFSLCTVGDVSSIPALLIVLRDEQIRAVKMWLGAALIALGNHSPTAIAAVEQRFAEWDLQDDAGGIALAALAKAGIPMKEDASWDDTRAGMKQLGAFWREHGYPMGTKRPACAAPSDLEPRLRAILAAEIVSLAEFQLRPVDLAREVNKNMGVLALPLLHISVTAAENYVRAHSLEIVRDIGPPARPLEDVLLPLLDDPTSRLLATEAIGAIRSPLAVPRLREQLASTDLDLAAAAAAALGEIGDETARKPLDSILGDSKSQLDLKVYAAFGLARLDRSKADGGAGEKYLRDLLATKAYHEPTLNEMLSKIHGD